MLFRALWVQVNKIVTCAVIRAKHLEYNSDGAKEVKKEASA